MTPGVPTTGCDNFARFLELAPVCYFRGGTGHPARVPVLPPPTRRFDLEEGSLTIAVEALALAAVRVLETACDGVSTWSG